ncbi:MAG TPA: sugar ABC transporter ATP-binding protein [Pseudonocardia sp.]|uniref:sugar ABC transporter ATP-binding protein n=1 Tax=Pseudonocardia sp. TaxID=60912 RepID=UPI002B75A238|nr:sugar ABC transporter ATP-binding protein [Pseudonocardia sp.]HTF47203.1 sugar ABC transporter ATP-binding protein [Pseudonocardia sp.]
MPATDPVKPVTPEPAGTPGTEPALRMIGVSKQFGPVHALREVSVDFRAGEVTALMGENGAGKSTLLKVLIGALSIDAGTVELDGRPVTFADPTASRAAGVRVVAQEPEIIPHVSVAENIFVGALPARGRLFRKAELVAKAAELILRSGFGQVLHPETLGSRLTPAQRQLVEILRALTDQPRVIAFDEPTSSLADGEVELLFTLIRRLREQGVAVIYVSHRLKEVFALGDRIAVLRDGAHVGTRPVEGTSEAELIRMMVGRDLSSLYHDELARPAPGDVVLEVSGLSSADVRDISFQVRAGEIVGLAGLIGAGRTELVRALIGAEPTTAGTVTFQGQQRRFHSPRDAVRAGIGLAPEERKAEALFLQRSVRENTAAAIYDRIRTARVINRKKERATVAQFLDRLRVRTPGMEYPVANLSGGNQQKVVLARWLARNPALLILDEPTRGVDVGAKSEIYAIIHELAAAGIAILMVSSELPEVLGLADRIIVMQNGRITGELTRAEATEEGVLALAMADDLSDLVVGLQTETSGATP